MSNLKVNTINDASGGSAAVLYGVASPPNSMGFRNRIINGDMRIDQRNNGASVSPAASQYTLDRWNAIMNAASAKYSVQRNAGAVTPPTGFSNYLGITSLGAYTVAAGEIMAVQQAIEGFNIADLAWGTANAQSVTLSFWARSSLTGTFGGAVRQGSGARSYPFTYTISAANTWEFKTVNIAGDTSGTYASDNTAGLLLTFGMGVGSTFSGASGSWSGSNFVSATGATSVVGTNGATFYITGVQLEAGTVATPFERRDYGRELMMCQRYYYRRNYDTSSDALVAVFHAYSSSGAWGKLFDLPVEMRATPTASLSSIGHFRPSQASGSSSSAFTSGSLGQGLSRFQVTTGGWTGSSSLVAGNATGVLVNTTSAWIDASAEL